MTKHKLIIGTYNSVSPDCNNDQLEKKYQNSYKPLLKILYEFPRIKASLHYSGILLEWLDEYHPEIFSIINEMIKRRQVELIGGGFYDPIFSLIPGKDRLTQIELLTTYIRRKFGRRPRGFWLTEQVWEQHICSSIKSSGMNYIFLDENQFKRAGIEGPELYKPCYTEDQGKILTVIPIHTSLTDTGMGMKAAGFLELLSTIKIPEEGVYSLIFEGEKILSPKDIEWFKDLFSILTTSSNAAFSFERSGDYVRSLSTLKKLYFPASSGCNVEYLAMSTQKQKKWNKNKKFNQKNDQFCYPAGYFRQFLSKYEESNLLYSRMLYTHDNVSQIRKDKSRKRSASEEIFKSQSHFPFWHGIHQGFYDAHLRQHAYQCLIRAEKNIREKGIFSTHLHAVDFDMDGEVEYIYHGQFINGYVHRKGARLFELDYIISPWNYLNTIQRLPEYYHLDDIEKVYTDSYPRDAFVDHFFAENVTELDFERNNYTELGDFISKPFNVMEIDKEHKELVFEREGRVLGKTILLKKRYKFRKNLIEVNYRIENKSKNVFQSVFSTEINLSFKYPESIKLPVSNNDIRETGILDKENKVFITIQSLEKMNLWQFPVYSHTKGEEGIENKYQFQCFLFHSNISLKNEEVWENTFTIKLEKK